MVSTYIECLSCREMWQESTILDAVAGNAELAAECIERELCPECLIAADSSLAEWQEAESPPGWEDEIEIALRNQYGKLTWQEMREELDLPAF